LEPTDGGEHAIYIGPQRRVELQKLMDDVADLVWVRVYIWVLDLTLDVATSAKGKYGKGTPTTEKHVWWY
jgi:hypothetical protein